MSIRQSLSKIPRWIPITIVSAGVAYLIFNRIRKTVIFNKIMQEGARKEELNVSKTTITDMQATELAEALYKAFRPIPFGWGTDEKAVINALTGINSNDILLVEQKFGIRDGMNLRAYIKDEINEKSNDYAQVRALYQAQGLNL